MGGFCSWKGAACGLPRLADAVRLGGIVLALSVALKLRLVPETDENHKDILGRTFIT